MLNAHPPLNFLIFCKIKIEPTFKFSLVYHEIISQTFSITLAILEIQIMEADKKDLKLTTDDSISKIFNDVLNDFIVPWLQGKPLPNDVKMRK